MVTIVGPAQAGVQRLGLVRPQRSRSRARAARPPPRGAARPGSRACCGGARVLRRLHDEPLVVAPGLEQRVPGLDVADDGHAAMLGAASALRLRGSRRHAARRATARCCATPTAPSRCSAPARSRRARGPSVEVVIYSGRRRDDAVLRRAPDRASARYVFEAGAGVVLDGELHWLTGDLVPRDGKTIFDQIEESGAPALLLEHYAGRLEYHDPWHRAATSRTCSAATSTRSRPTRCSSEHGHEHLRLVDNGGIHPQRPGIEDAQRLPPRAAPERRRRAPSRATCAPAATRARSASRSATRARTSGAAAVVQHVLARRQRRRARPDDPRGAHRQHARLRRSATAPASTRP